MGGKLGIIGGGAAGLMAAVQGLRLGLDVTLLEGGHRPGKKLSATGNGRGNYANLALGPEKYPGVDPDFLQAAFSCFDQYDALAFFESIGIYPRLRNGYVYPRSEQAGALTEALCREIDRLGGLLLTDCKVQEIRQERKGFQVILQEEDSFSFDKLILAAGGLTAAKTGSDGSGFALSKGLGHEILPTVPALTGLTFFNDPLSKAAGVRTEASLKLRIHDVETPWERGELQITEGAISGIPVMHLSRYAALALNQDKKVEALMDFLPEWSREECRQILSQCKDLGGILPAKLSRALPKDREELLKVIKAYPLTITGLRDPETAQVTCGGVSLKEVDPRTMASLLVKGLFFAGEILDVDGRCGGYNLQWAWTSGTLAAYGAAGVPCNHQEPDPPLLKRLAQAEVADRRK